MNLKMNQNFWFLYRKIIRTFRTTEWCLELFGFWNLIDLFWRHFLKFWMISLWTGFLKMYVNIFREKTPIFWSMLFWERNQRRFEFQEMYFFERETYFLFVRIYMNEFREMILELCVSEIFLHFDFHFVRIIFGGQFLLLLNFWTFAWMVSIIKSDAFLFRISEIHMNNFRKRILELSEYVIFGRESILKTLLANFRVEWNKLAEIAESRTFLRTNWASFE